MRKIQESDVLDIARYELARDELRKRAMRAKEVRRVAIGPLVTVLFENRTTLHYQLQEMMRVERIVRPEAIREEMAIWNDLVPARDELSLTLMIEITDLTIAKAKLEELRDLEETVTLRFGPHVVHARFEEGWRDDNRISAVQFIRFALSNDERNAFLASSDVSLKIDHAAYAHEARLSTETLAALREDLEAE
ncbi:DUF3501 family protein [bacterium]|nr:DUF3501 family protein [bacterium]